MERTYTASTLKRRLRSKEFSKPIHNELGIRVVDVTGINLQIAILAGMGEQVQEFETFLKSLLLQQIEELNNAMKVQTNISKRAKLAQLLLETKQILWPLQN